MTRIIDVTDRTGRVNTDHFQIVFHAGEGEQDPERVPAEDIGLLILDTGRCSISTSALRRLSEACAAVLLTDERHLPTALMLPLNGHTLATARLRSQVSAPLPRRKQAWRQIVVAKIRAQAANCGTNPEIAERLHEIATGVRSGDAGNAEGVAAALYWRAFWKDEHFKRRPRESDDFRNVLLDYGYGVLRASCARALVKAGLHPALGIQHRSRDNPFCLADDLMEPLRPLIDRIAFGVFEAGARELNRNARVALLGCLSHTVYSEVGRGPMDTALERYASSLALFLEGKSEKIDIPVAP